MQPMREKHIFVKIAADKLVIGMSQPAFHSFTECFKVLCFGQADSTQLNAQTVKYFLEFFGNTFQLEKTYV